MESKTMNELTEEQLAEVQGGVINQCTVFAGLNAAAVGFALAGIGVATAGWGALAATGAYLACSAGEGGSLGQIGDVIAP
jgi:bacteriocin-like protein